jgi:hypothetical protein
MARGFGQRYKKRGAAMVEAGIIAPIFVMFWMLMMQLSGTYQYKILTTQETRYQAFYMAVHDCKTMGPAPDAPVTSQSTISNPDTGVNPNNEKPPADNKGILNSVMGGFDKIASKLGLMANVQADATWDYKAKSNGTIGDKVTWDMKQQGDNGVFHLIPTHVKSTSFVFCSPGKGPPTQDPPSIPSL